MRERRDSPERAAQRAFLRLITEDRAEVAALVQTYNECCHQLVVLWRYNSFVYTADGLRHIAILRDLGVGYDLPRHALNKLVDVRDINPEFRSEFPVRLPGGSTLQLLQRRSAFQILGVPETDPRFGVLPNRINQPHFRLDIPGSDAYFLDPIGVRGLQAHQMLLLTKNRAMDRLVDLYRAKLPGKYRLVRLWV